MFILTAYDAPLVGDWWGHRYGSKHSDGTVCKHTNDVLPIHLETWLNKYINNAKIAFVMDKSLYAQVWNQPIYKYDITKTKTTTQTGWIKNVTCKIWYAVEWSDYDQAGASHIQINYTYKLEDTDNDNKVDKSAWTGSSINDHPDFFWFPIGAGPGTSSNSINPYVNKSTVKTILGHPKVGLFVKDNSADKGIEPSKGDYWHSPDIWTVPSKLLPGNKVKLWTKARNESGLNINDLNVTFYRSAPNVGTMNLSTFPAQFKIAEKSNVSIGYYKNSDISADWTVPNTTPNYEGCIGVALASTVDPVSNYWPAKCNNVAANNFFIVNAPLAADFSEFPFTIINSEDYPVHIFLDLHLIEGPPGWFVELIDPEENVLTEVMLEDYSPREFFGIENFDNNQIGDFRLRLHRPQTYEVGEIAFISLRSTLISAENPELVQNNGITMQVRFVDKMEIGRDCELFLEPDSMPVFNSGEFLVHFQNQEPVQQLEFTIQGDPVVFESLRARTTGRTEQFNVQQSEQENGMHFQLIPRNSEALISESDEPILHIHYQINSRSQRGQVGQIRFDDIAAYNQEQQLPVQFHSGQYQVEQGPTNVNRNDAQKSPLAFALLNNYPNPCNPSTAITYRLPETSIVKLQIFDIRGRKVKTLVNEEQKAEAQRVIWNGRDVNDRLVSSGYYFCRLHARPVNGNKSFQATIKMLLLK